ncbi:PQQ-binding-like beta-propeller repeat protein [Salarchaeum sp. III]|uniref:outer membrane protein assembly factor BamB family protein n=1 Tax=Salarchaeum sp. III TaxID=3107927 RepID=UPI002EDAB500
MNRRQFLSGVAGGGGLLLAGCLSPEYTKTHVYSAGETMIAGPTVTDDTAYFTIQVRSRDNKSNAGTLLGVDLTTGTRTAKIPYIVEYASWERDIPLQSTRPIVDDQQVFIGGRAPVAYDLSGQELWTVDFVEQFSAQASLRPPRVTDDTVYFGLSTGDICALHRETGEVLWKTSLGDGGISGWKPLEASIIAVDTSGVIAMLNQESGAIERQRTFKRGGDGGPFTVGSALSVRKDGVYVEGNGIVSRFGRELQTTWTQPLPLDWAHPPVITENNCYVIGEKPEDSTGYLYKVDRESGRLEWEKSLAAKLGGWEAVRAGDQIYTWGENQESVGVTTLDGDVVYEIPFESQIAGVREIEDGVSVLTTDGELFKVS